MTVEVYLRLCYSDYDNKSLEKLYIIFNKNVSIIFLRYILRG